jgi:hypothetical protein
MAIYKLFPEKDATIYSEYELKNTGIDEILELDLAFNNNTPAGVSGSLITEVSRYALKFPDSGITNIIDNKISGSYKAYLKLFVANASKIPIDYTLECYPISGAWNMGTGRFDISPEVQNGVNWEFRSNSGSNAWLTSSFTTYATASFISTSYQSRPGGGNWYTGSTTLNPVATQSFTYITTKDISFDVTNAVTLQYSGSKGIVGGIINDGLLVKNTDANEFNSNVQFNLKYFSMDTHTVYPPQLEFRWNDITFDTGSSTSTITTDLNPVVSLGNNKQEFEQNSIQKFRVYARDRFPTRAFQTSSVYLTNKYLPSSSYYSVVDLNSGDTVFDFDTDYTKIGADSTSNYFTLYMDGLEPERYYKILIKTIIDGTELVLDDDYYFKVKL